MNNLNLAIQLFLQLAVILLFCRAVGAVAARFGQLQVVGKGVACWLAARVTGLPQREALGIGVLMNARGLLELIINIGLQRGIISEGFLRPWSSWPW